MVKGLLATPAGTAAAVLQRLEAETQKALATPAFKERMAVLGATPGLPTSAQFTRVIQDKIRRWAPKTAATIAQRQ